MTGRGLGEHFGPRSRKHGRARANPPTHVVETDELVLVLPPFRRAILIAVCGDWLAPSEEHSMADSNRSRASAPYWPDSGDLGSAASRQLSGVQRSCRERRRKGSP